MFVKFQLCQTLSDFRSNNYFSNAKLFHCWKLFSSHTTSSMQLSCVFRRSMYSVSLKWL